MPSKNRPKITHLVTSLVKLLASVAVKVEVKSVNISRNHGVYESAVERFLLAVCNGVGFF